MKMDIVNALNHLVHLRSRGFLPNGALILLLPKMADSLEVTSYKSISLVHSFGKLFSKLLATRLAPQLPRLVKGNQAEFVGGRNIHDNFRMVHLATKALHARRAPALLLKINIAKAFDTVSWSFLLRILRHMGFSERWVEWICIIFRSSSSRVLPNGVPGRPFWHRRGVRQGDPLSPMIFLLVMEALNALFRLEEDEGMLAPIPYAAITNFAKCFVTPIRCGPQRLQIISDAFP